MLSRSSITRARNPRNPAGLRAGSRNVLDDKRSPQPPSNPAAVAGNAVSHSYSTQCHTTSSDQIRRINFSFRSTNDVERSYCWAISRFVYACIFKRAISWSCSSPNRPSRC